MDRYPVSSRAISSIGWEADKKPKKKSIRKRFSLITLFGISRQIEEDEEIEEDADEEDDDKGTLEIEFKNGAVYQYRCTRGQFRSFQNARSLGSYFYHNFR